MKYFPHDDGMIGIYCNVWKVPFLFKATKHVTWTLKEITEKCNNENRNHLLLFVLLSRSSKSRVPTNFRLQYAENQEKNNLLHSYHRKYQLITKS